MRIAQELLPHFCLLLHVTLFHIDRCHGFKFGDASAHLVRGEVLSSGDALQVVLNLLSRQSHIYFPRVLKQRPENCLLALHQVVLLLLTLFVSF